MLTSGSVFVGKFDKVIGHGAFVASLYAVSRAVPFAITRNFYERL